MAIAVNTANEARISAAAAGGAGYRGLEAESLRDASWYLQPSEEVLTLHEVRARRQRDRRRGTGFVAVLFLAWTAVAAVIAWVTR
jgi:hypothetical protein